MTVHFKLLQNGMLRKEGYVKLPRKVAEWLEPVNVTVAETDNWSYTILALTCIEEAGN